MTLPILQPVVLPAQVKSALIHPQRAMELRGWLKTNKDTARRWRGEDNETMMHWAFLSDWVWASELREAGLSFNDTDRHGRTPMDWLNDRLWSAVVEPTTNHQLSAGGQERLRRHTETQVQHLWPQGARPSQHKRSLHPGVVWIRSGAWSLLPLLCDTSLNNPDETPEEKNSGSAPSYEGWMHWTPRRGHALHAWVLSPNTPGRRQFLHTWQAAGLDVDVRDEDGRTPLWYAVEAWVAAPTWRTLLVPVIQELLQAQADVHAEDLDGTTPLSVLTRESAIHDDVAYQKMHATLDPNVASAPPSETEEYNEDPTAELERLTALHVFEDNAVSTSQKQGPNLFAVNTLRPNTDINKSE